MTVATLSLAVRDDMIVRSRLILDNFGRAGMVSISESSVQRSFLRQDVSRTCLSVLTMTPNQKVFGKSLREKARDIVPNSPIDVHVG